MSTSPEVEAAAENYLGLPFNFGTETNLIRIAEHDAFIAGVEWACGHPQTGSKA